MKLQSNHWLLLFLVSASACAPASQDEASKSTSNSLALGTTYYVATDGDDSRSCSEAESQDWPRRSINGGVECLSAGDTLYVKGGVYNESIVNSVPSGTSWSNMVRIAAVPGQAVWLKP